MNAKTCLLLTGVLLLIVTSVVSAKSSIDEALQSNEDCATNKRSSCNCGWIGATVGGVGILVALKLSRYLAANTDYLGPTNYFTLTRDRNWKLPHEQYEAEQLSKADEVFDPEGE